MIKYVAIGGIYAIAFVCNYGPLPLDKALAFSAFEVLVLLGILKVASYA